MRRIIKLKAMINYNLNIEIEENGTRFQKAMQLTAVDKKELSEKLNALAVLSEVLEHDDFITTVEVIKEKPGLIPVVKEMLEEGENLSEAQLLARLPKYVRRVLKVLKS